MEGRERFFRAIAERIDVERVEEVHLFPAIRQGGRESGVAVLTLRPEQLESDVVAMETDISTTESDEAATESDLVATESDVIATESDVIATESDVIATESDSVSTGPDASVMDTHASATETDLSAMETEVPAVPSASADANDHAADVASMANVPEDTGDQGDIASMANDSDDGGDESDIASVADDASGDATGHDDIAAGDVTHDDVLAEEEGVEPPPTQPAPAPPPPRRFTVLRAHYRLQLKGPDRGKWEVGVVEEADAPSATVDEVVRGVHERAGGWGVEGPERLTGDEFRAALSEEPWSAAR
ncbi:MAG TPA: hypothetical protein VFR95_12255 [Gemmatimonadaceae bacterium]|nr:hypothetical protein [Gemmatimonadaceae bacterium]